jgi:hypothetical protein
MNDTDLFQIYLRYFADKNLETIIPMRYCSASAKPAI